MVRLYEWMDGTALSLGRETPGIVAELLGRLHAQDMWTQDAPDAWHEEVPAATYWAELLEGARHGQAPWAADLAAAMATIDELRGVVAPSLDPARRMCHLDLQVSNLLEGPDGLVLLDWDNAGPGVPDRELASLLQAWAKTRRAIDPETVGRMIAAYRRAGGIGRVTDESAFSMRIATSLNFIYVQAQLALDPAAAREHRDLAHAWTQQTIRALPNPRMFGPMIQAVRAADRSSPVTR